MRAVKILARDALGEFAKRRVLLAILVAGALTAVIFAVAVAVVPLVVQRIVENMSVENQRPDPAQLATLVKQLNTQGCSMVVTVFSMVIEILGTLLAIIMFSTLLPTEIERGSIKFLISKPVSRLDVILGKWTAGGAVLLGYSAGAAALTALAGVYLTGGLSPEDAHTLPFLFFKLLLRGSVAMCLSIAMKPILAGVLAFFVSGDLFGFLAGLTGTSVPHYIFAAIAYLLPNYSIFPLRSFLGSLARAMGANVPDLTLLDMALRGGYAMLYIAALLFLTAKLFEKRDLT